MRATRQVAERRFVRIRWPQRHAEFMTPLPPRRKLSQQLDERGGEWETWWGREVHPEIHGPLRQVATLILWLLIVMCLILLFAEFWQ